MPSDLVYREDAKDYARHGIPTRVREYDECCEKETRPDWCPLTKVSEPHGRLIDADKLKETLDYYISEAGWSDEINKALSWVKDEFIDSEQTVIPASEEGET